MKLNKNQKKALIHKDKLGEGAKKRKALLYGPEKIPVVMKEFKRGTLHSGSGKIVPKSRPDIAIAIALSEAGKSKKKKKTRK